MHNLCCCDVGGRLAEVRRQKTGTLGNFIAADVDGLFTADPKRRNDASLLEVARPEDLDRIEFSTASRTDVTGSIEGKVRRMFEIAGHAGECLIVNGNVKNRVRDALRGRRVVGTRVVRGP